MAGVQVPKIISSDQAWLEWIATQKRISELASQGAPAAAIAAIDKYLNRNPPADIHSDALAYKASLFEDLGDLGSARENWLAALRLTAGGYQKYSIELSLGCLEQECSRSKEATRWYLCALETAKEDGSISSGTVLLKLARLRGLDKLTPRERSLAQREASRSWQVLRLEGEPDLDELEKTARILIEAQGRPLRH